MLLSLLSLSSEVQSVLQWNWKKFFINAAFFILLSFVVRNEGNQSLGAKRERWKQMNSRLIIIFHRRHRTNDERHTTGTRLMTRQTMGTIMLSKMAKKDGKKCVEEINWRRMLRNRKVRRVFFIHRIHTYEFRGKIKFNLIYLFMVLTTTHSRSSPFFTHSSTEKRRRRGKKPPTILFI